MAKVTEHRFTVTGVGAFPIDMLRYDVCTPYSGTDSGHIQHWSAGPEREIKLRGPRAPTIGRWESFGWRVVEHETVKR